MKIGFSLVRHVPHLQMFSQIAPQLAARAEQLGFESAWISEHMVKPVELPHTHQYAEGGRSIAEPDTDLYDPWVALAMVAAATSRLRLGTMVYVLPLRNPFVTARAVCTLDVLSGGRAILGTGVGWLQPEFEIVGETWHNRGARTSEIMEIIQKLWTESEPEFHGKFYDFGPCKFVPKPLAAQLLGSGGVKGAMERAARWCDGWIADPKISLDYKAIEQHILELKVLRKEFGRDDRPFEITMVFDLHAGKPALAHLESIGVTRAVVTPWTKHEADTDSLAHGFDDLDRAAALLF